MNGAAKAFIAIVVLAGIGAGAFFLAKDKPAVNPVSDRAAAEDSQVTATITYSSNGFSPTIISVKPGGAVKIVNNSSQTLDFASDPHPFHTDNSELNVGFVASGGAKTFMVTKTGSWGYHNHLNSNDTGHINVE